MDNLINLCHKCHIRLHMNEGYESSRIVALKGMSWFKKLEKMKNEIVKANAAFYKENLQRLQALLASLSS